MDVSVPALLIICGTLLVVVLVLFLPLSRSQAKANRPASRAFARDDERYWYGGFFYNNPDDPDAFVPKRSGIGWTVNFGHPVGKWILIGIVLLGLVVPLVVAVLGALYPGLIHSSGCHPSGCHLFP